MSALISVFPPANDESAIGYIRRLGIANGYNSWRSLMHAAEINPSRHALWKSRQRLCRALGIDDSWLTQVFPDNTTGIGHRHHFFGRADADPVCPACLLDNPYVRQAWNHSLVTACPEHKVALLDICPSCDLPLQQTRWDIARCDCGFELSAAKPSGVSALQLWVSSRLQGAPAPVDGLFEIGSGSDYIKLGELLFNLSVRFDPTETVLPAKVRMPKTIAESQRVLAPLEWLFADWPNNFKTHLQTRLAAGPANRFTLSGRLGPWYLALSKQCQGSHFSPVWQAFSDVIIETFDGNLRGAHTLTPSPNVQRKYLSAAETAHSLGMSPTVLRRGIREGQVQAVVTKQGTQYALAMIERSEIERVRKLRSNWQPVSVASQILQTPESILNSLVGAGLLEHDPDWQKSALKTGPVSIESLGGLKERLLAYQVKRECSETIPFRELTGRRTSDVTALKNLFKAIFRGELPSVGAIAGAGIGGLLFDATEVKRYLGSVALDSGYTLLQLEKALGWKYESLAYWVDTGLLGSENILLRGKHARIVPLPALIEFQRTWLPISEIAKLSGSKASAITRKLRAQGVAIAGGKTTSSGTQRGGLVRITDILTKAGFGPLLISTPEVVGGELCLTG